MTIIWLWPGELNTPNRARYQRVMRVTMRHNVILLNKRSSRVSDQIRTMVYEVRSSPRVNNLVIEYLFYYIHVLIQVPLIAFIYWGGGRPIIYSCADFTAILAFLLSQL